MLGASGYTGGELVRVLLRHPRAEIVLLTAERSAGKAMRDVFPQKRPRALARPLAHERNSSRTRSTTVSRSAFGTTSEPTWTFSATVSVGKTLSVCGTKFRAHAA